MRPGQRLLIVGGGPAGLSAARAYREAKGRARVTILAAENFPPYRRPPLTKEYLRGEVPRNELPLQAPRWYVENGVELRTGTAAAGLDLTRGVVETESGEEIAYDACVLATGSEPVRLPVPGGEDPGVPVVRTVEDSTRLRERAVGGRRAVVVGSGFIGCEVAASLALRGLKVGMASLEELPQKDRLGGEVGLRILRWLEGYGIAHRLGTSLERIERRGERYAVSLKDGEILEAEVVVFGTGVRPRTILAKEAGIEVRRGVIADSSMRTGTEGVFAAGDVAEAFNEAAGRRLSVEHWGDALEQGRIAGRVIAGEETRWDGVPGFWSTVGEKTLKYWSWGDGWDEYRFEERGDSFVARYGRDGALVGVLAHNSDEAYERGREEIRSGVPFIR